MAEWELICLTWPRPSFDPQGHIHFNLKTKEGAVEVDQPPRHLLLLPDPGSVAPNALTEADNPLCPGDLTPLLTFVGTTCMWCT